MRGPNATKVRLTLLLDLRCAEPRLRDPYGVFWQQLLLCCDRSLLSSALTAC